MRPRILWVAPLLAVVLLMSGCWDRMEIEDQSYVILLGIDRAAENHLFVTALVAEVSKLSVGALESSVTPSRSSLAAEVLTARAATLTQALHIMNGGMTRNLDLRHMRGVVVGENLARDGLEPVLMELNRRPLSRGNAFIALGRGVAHDVIVALHPVAEVNPARMTEGFLLQAKTLHLAPPIRMHTFLSHLAAVGTDPFLPTLAVNRASGDLLSPLERTDTVSALAGAMPRAGGNPVEMIGTALFRGDRLAGFLNVDQTQMLLAMKGSMGKAYMSFPDPDNPEARVTMRFHQENFPEVKAVLRGRTPSVDMKIKFEGELLAAPGGTNFADAAARLRLEKAAGVFADKAAREVADRLLEWQVDPVGLGQRFRGQFSTWGDWVAFKWHQRLGSLRLTVDTSMRVRRYGHFTGPDRARIER